MECRLGNINDSLSRQNDVIDKVAGKLGQLRETFETRTDAEIEKAESRLDEKIKVLSEAQRYLNRLLVGVMVSTLGAIGAALLALLSGH